MLKRTLSLCLALLFALLLIPPEVHALSVTDNIVIIEDQARHEQIDQLFALRSQYEFDFETNRERIEQIDLQLESLGVETLSNTEIAQLRGNTNAIAPCATYPATDAYTTWTSRTMIVTYMGIHHELQIIEGVPTDVGSPLWRDDSDTEYASAGVAAGLLNAAHVTGVSAVCANPIVGSYLSVGVTAYDALQAIIAGMTTNTIIKNITGVALVTLTSHEKYIFVKVQGSSNDRQILCYAGNRATYTISTLASTSIDGIPTHSANLNITDSSTSKYYSEGYGAYATQVYYEYTRGISPDPRNDFHIMSVTIDIFGTERCFDIPYGFLVS